MSKVILITGASSGIGKSISLFLTNKGFKVYGTCRDPKKYNILEFELLKCDINSQVDIEDTNLSTNARAERIISAKQMEKTLGQLLDTLPEQQALALRMYYYEDKKVEDIAAEFQQEAQRVLNGVPISSEDRAAEYENQKCFDHRGNKKKIT